MSIAIISCASLPAPAQETFCPKTIKVQSTINQVPDGWTAASDYEDHILAGITFFSGPPAEKASLKYDSWKKRNGLARAVWNFPADSGRRFWISCKYVDTDVVLTKELSPEISQCNVIYNPKVNVAGYPEIRSIECR